MHQKLYKGVKLSTMIGGKTMNMKIDDMSTETIKKYLEQREEEETPEWLGVTLEVPTVTRHLELKVN